MQNKKILVTGGCGFVGRNLVKLLLKEKNIDIWIVDDLSTGTRPETWLPFLTCSKRLGVNTYQFPDSSNRVMFIKKCFLTLTLKIINKEGYNQLNVMLPRFDEVYHLASIVGGRNVIEKKPLYVGLDLAIDSAFFMWAGEIARPKRILYASSSAAYPVNYQKAGRSRLLREENIQFSKNLGIPDLTYGWSKLTGEFLAKIGVEKYGLSIGVVRPFSGYGEDQEPVYPFPAIALRVAARSSPVRVWGSGKQTRDFIHIQDACEACLAVCRNESKGGAYNIGSGIATSFLDLAKRMIKIEGYEADVVGTLGKPVGVAERICDPKKIKNKFGWKQKISLDEGIRRALSFAKMRLNSGIKPE